MKRCSHCYKEKLLHDFNYNRSKLDGYQSWCRDCLNEYKRKNKDIRRSTIPGMKICADCKIEKPINNFNLNQITHDGYQSWCRNCQKKYRQKYQCDFNLQRNFGITEAHYDLMLKSQNGVCAICGQSETTKSNSSNKLRRLSVDHCHKTHKIRGLLCNNCNKSLGGFKDDSELLRKAANYLEVSK